jgi:hypothetical protein
MKQIGLEHKIIQMIIPNKRRLLIKLNYVLDRKEEKQNKIQKSQTNKKSLCSTKE